MGINVKKHLIVLAFFAHGRGCFAKKFYVPHEAKAIRKMSKTGRQETDL